VLLLCVVCVVVFVPWRDIIPVLLLRWCLLLMRNLLFHPIMAGEQAPNLNSSFDIEEARAQTAAFRTLFRNHLSNPGTRGN
jgi:hypothetical protein